MIASKVASESAVHPAVLCSGCVCLRNCSAHHGGQGQRDDRRDEDRHAEGHGELAEEPPDDVSHEEERNQHRDQRDRSSETIVKPISSAPLSAAERGSPLLDVPHDVLDHHDRVVDDEAGRDRERPSASGC